MNVLERVHEGYVVSRRSRVHCEQLAPLIPRNARVLDVGCGDGLLAALLKRQHPDLELRGVEVAARPKAHIPIEVFDGQTLSFMDWVGNARHGVALPHTYWTKPQWLDAFQTLGLTVREWRQRLELYPWPANLVFERSLHFIDRLEVRPP